MSYEWLGELWWWKLEISQFSSNDDVMAEIRDVYVRQSIAAYNEVVAAFNKHKYWWMVSASRIEVY